MATSACVALAAWCLAVDPAHAQPAAPAPVAPDYSSTSGVIPWSAIMEKPLAAGTANADSPQAVGNAAAGRGSSDASKGGGNASHEELSQSSLKESIREFNAGDNAVKKPDAGEANATANPLRKPVTSAAAKAAQKANNDQWAAISLRDEMVADALPWAYGVATLLAVGFGVKVWLNYMQAKAARPGLRRRAARRRSHRSTAITESAGIAGSAPESQGAGNPLTGAGGEGGTGGKGGAGGASASASSGTPPGASGRRRHRSHRSQL